MSGCWFSGQLVQPKPKLGVQRARSKPDSLTNCPCEVRKVLSHFWASGSMTTLDCGYPSSFLILEFYDRYEFHWHFETYIHFIKHYIRIFFSLRLSLRIGSRQESSQWCFLLGIVTLSHLTGMVSVTSRMLWKRQHIASKAGSCKKLQLLAGATAH